MTEDPTYRSSLPKRAFAVLMFILPFFAIGLAGYWSNGNTIEWWAWVPIGFGLSVGALNFFLSFIRTSIHRWQKGNMDDYRFVSGFPIIGTLIAVAGAWICQGGLVALGLAFVILIIDTGGFPWFVLSTWKDNSLWGNQV